MIPLALSRAATRGFACLLLVFLFSTPGTAQVAGVVRDSATGLPIEGALVTRQATSERTVTDATGNFMFPSLSGTNLVIVGAKKGYFNGSVTTTAPSLMLEIALDVVQQDDDPNYVWVDPAQCSICHPTQWNQWSTSRMSETGLNQWVYDLYDGSATAGGMNDFVYTQDSVHFGANPGGYCASCHQPEAWIENPFTPLAPFNAPNDAALRGVSCESCHKIADVDESLINAPGFIPGTVTFTRPDSTMGVNQVMYGTLGDVDYNAAPVMRASYQPQLVAEACAVCHEYNNDPDNDGDFEEAGSVPAQETYSEWKNSPYGDPANPLYQSCVDCHKAEYAANDVDICTAIFPPLLRDPTTVRSHEFEGTTPAYLENAVTMTMSTQQVGGDLEVAVDIVNDQTGHAVPTGVTLRNMILLIQAEGQSSGVLTQSGGDTIHPLGGIGDPATGNYAGLPGKLFAKVNQNAAGTEGVLFTEAVSILFDNRIAPLATDTTTVSFAVPSTGGNVEVRARLIYRRAPKDLIEAKGWTLDGLGNPLNDVQAPHFGTLMEEEVATLVTTPPPSPDFIRGDCNQDLLADISDAITMLGVLFSGLPTPTCEDACDSNDDGQSDVGDPIYLLATLFGGGPLPPPPYPDCGSDPTAGDPLGCATSSCP